MRGKDAAFYSAINGDYPTHPVCCRAYDSTTSGIDPSTSAYLKFLRHLGKKHPSIVHTWEIFTDPSTRSIEIFQEYCANGNLEKAVTREGAKAFDDTEIALYAWQLARGMDFLGDIGICHRKRFLLYPHLHSKVNLFIRWDLPGAIAPRNLVLRQAVKYNMLKITNFREAIIYWNIETSDIAWASCLPAKQQATDGANYQAPEVYSENPEQEAYDPVVSDTYVVFLLVLQIHI